MKLRTKIFLLFTVFLVILIATLTAFQTHYFTSKMHGFYNEKYEALAIDVSNSLKLIEDMSDQKLYTSTIYLKSKNDSEFKNQTLINSLKSKTDVSEIYVISPDGRFLYSTSKTFHSIPPSNLYDYCSDYKNLANTDNFIVTPILPLGTNNTPAKFLIMGDKANSRIIEASLDITNVYSSLKGMVESHPEIKLIGLFTPTSEKLGLFFRDKNNKDIELDKIKDAIINGSKNNSFISNDTLYILKKHPVAQTQCCECKNKGIVSKDGSYFYTILIGVDLADSIAVTKSINKTSVIVFIVFLTVFIFAAYMVATRFVRKIKRLVHTIETVELNNYLPHFSEDFGKDEIGYLASAFQNLLQRLINYQNELIESEKSKVNIKLAQQVAHDIRSPLEVLKGLKSELSGIPEEPRRLVRMSINRIEEIAYNLLKLNKPTSTNQEDEQCRSEEILSLLESILTEKKFEYLNHKDIDIIMNFDEKSYGLFSKVIPSALKRVISNLLNNAYDAIGNNPGTITVSLFGTGNSNLIQMTDTGCGIKENIKSNIFANGFSTKKTGNGLGLSGSREIISSFGGGISFESEIGKGTTFTISLPESEPTCGFLQSIEAYQYEHIIILDDDNSFHEIWKNKLELVQYKTEHLYSSKELFNRYTALPEKTLLLTDFELTDDEYDGIDIIQKYSHSKNSVLITARSGELAIKDRCSKHGIRLLDKTSIRYLKVSTLPS